MCYEAGMQGMSVIQIAQTQTPRLSTCSPTQDGYSTKFQLTGYSAWDVRSTQGILV